MQVAFYYSYAPNRLFRGYQGLGDLRETSVRASTGLVFRLIRHKTAISA